VVKLPIEKLMDIQVTTATRAPEKPAPAIALEAVMQTPAAIYVITQEDIRRSGFTSIPEVLRLAPGLDVARINSSQWAISARGFNSVLANKLLVLVDGRSVYDPAFSGTFWDVQDTLLDDIDRIEVIRGPGATLWGPNAVNGVINIITRSAKETQGALGSAGLGTQERLFANGRYGSQLASDLFLRGYAKYFNRDAQDLPSGAEAFDAWWGARGGLRLDWDMSSEDRVTVLGDGYVNRNGAQGQVPQLIPPFAQVRQGHTFAFGTNLLARWNHVFSERTDMKVQLYYDYSDRDTFLVLHFRRHTIDFDYQLRTAVIPRNVITWGVGYRLYVEHTEAVRAALVPADRNLNLFTLFVLDDVRLIDDRLHVLAGTKVEHNVFTGFEAQPSARLLWTPAARHTLWAAFSRAIREPSRAENDSITDLAVQPPAQPGAPPVVVRTLGNKDVRAESVHAYELGYRVRPHERLSADIAGFYSSYRDLTSLTPGTVFPEALPAPAHLVAPQVASNRGSGRTVGVELALNAQPVGPWRLAANYSYLHISLRNLNAPFLSAENSPQHQASLRSLLDLPYHLELDGMLRFVGALAGVPRYIEVDARLGWRPNPHVQVSLTGQNLVHAHHPEFALQIATEVPRSVYFKLELRI
jgi:iron complex outermembrane receptor protein